MGSPFKYRPSFVAGALMLTWGIASAFGLLALIGRWEARSFLRDSAAATGEVRAVRVRIDAGAEKDRTEHYRPVVVFRAGGREVEFEGRTETLDETKWQVGRRVDVRYRAADPEDARIDAPEELYASERGMWVGAVVGFAAGVVVAVMAKLTARFGARTSSGEGARRAHFGEHD